MGSVSKPLGFAREFRDWNQRYRVVENIYLVEFCVLERLESDILSTNALSRSI
jgi:hypothetical protein